MSWLKLLRGFWGSASLVLLVTVPALAFDAPWSLDYHDGSANRTRIWQDSAEGPIQFEYHPVQPEQSSTGFYSGGRPVSGELNPKQAEEILSQFRKLQIDTSLRVQDRMKGTGAFTWKEKSQTQSFIIQAGPPLREFDSLLDKLTTQPHAFSYQGPFPIFPGAILDAKQGGATSIQPGRNYRVTVYLSDKPLSEVLGFYETHLRKFLKTPDSDGKVQLTTGGGSVRLSQDVHHTRIQISEGPQ